LKVFGTKASYESLATKIQVYNVQYLPMAVCISCIILITRQIAMSFNEQISILKLFRFQSPTSKCLVQHEKKSSIEKT